MRFPFRVSVCQKFIKKLRIANCKMELYYMKWNEWMWVQANACECECARQGEGATDSMLDGASTRCGCPAISVCCCWKMVKNLCCGRHTPRPTPRRLVTDSFAVTRPLVRQNSLAAKLEAAAFLPIFTIYPNKGKQSVWVWGRECRESYGMEAF